MESADRGPDPADGLILVVEDEALVRYNLAQELRRSGYRVIEACSGDEARHLIDRGTPTRLLITDLRMPGRFDGALLARYVRLHSPETKIIVMSGHLAETETAALADATFAKPLHLPSLFTRVHELIGVNSDKRGDGLA